VTRQRFWLSWILFFFILGGCVPAPAPVISNPEDMIATIAAATVSALPTNTPYPTWTSTPISTRVRSTPTDLPTNTPAPTIEVIQLPAPGTPMADLTKLPLGFWSPTPEPYQCDVDRFKPEPYSTIKPRNFFRVEWRIWNRGSAIWKADGVFVYFIGGDKLYNDEEKADGFFLPYAVYPNDRFWAQVPMTSPKEPGTYSSMWGLRRENRNTPFCTFQVIIRVK
jgi:hypothetical protein